MRGISEERLKAIYGDNYTSKYEDAFILKLLSECHELQEPWIPLDEFLKSGFTGLCWITLKDYPQTYAVFDGREFNKEENLINDKIITNVMPIHKPEPPK